MNTYSDSDNPHSALIIDDHPSLRKGLINTLIDVFPDMDAREAGTVDQAIAILEQHQPSIILLDITLAEGPTAGLDAVPQLRQHAPETPILMLSMHAEEEYGAKAIEVGAFGYITKERPIEEMLDAVRMLLDGGTYFSADALARFSRIGTESENTLDDPIQSLTRTERKILALIGEGLPPRAIAEDLYISARTVETHRRNIRRKLNIDDAMDLLRYAIEQRKNLDTH